jgi:hypothetical protein
VPGHETEHDDESVSREFVYPVVGYEGEPAVKGMHYVMCKGDKVRVHVVFFVRGCSPARSQMVLLCEWAMVQGRRPLDHMSEARTGGACLEKY